MILESGTYEQMKLSAIRAMLPPVGSRWAWLDHTNSLKVTRVDDDIIYAQFSDLALNFAYTISYWVRELSTMPDWRRLS